MITEAELRRAIFNIIQPLRRGKSVQVDGLRATLGDLIGMKAGENDDGFMRTSPFGFIAKPTPNTFAYYNNLNGDPLAPIILGWQHQKRPDPTDIGGSIVYSTDETGEEVKAFLELFKDGKINFQSVPGSLIQMKSTGEILIGSAASAEPLVLGTAFTVLFNAHTHPGNLGALTGVPTVPMDATQISAKSFTEI